MKYRKKQSALGKLLLMSSPVLLGACNSALLTPKGQIAQEQRSLILTAFCLMLIVVIPVIFMSILFVWK